MTEADASKIAKVFAEVRGHEQQYDQNVRLHIGGINRGYQIERGISFRSRVGRPGGEGKGGERKGEGAGARGGGGAQGGGGGHEGPQGRGPQWVSKCLDLYSRLLMAASLMPKMK